MATLLQSWDGGAGAANGTTLSAANTAGPGNTAVQVTIGSGATAAFSNTRATDGTLSALFTTGATAATVYANWTTAWGTQSTSFMWADVYLTAAPAANLRVVGALVNTSTLAAAVVISPTRQILILNSAGATVYTSPTNVVPVGAWFRIEFAVTHNATTGTAQVKLYTTLSSTTPALDSGSLTSVNTGASSTIVRYGIGQSGANLSVWLDRLGGSSTVSWGQAPAGPSTVALTPAAITLTAGPVTPTPQPVAVTLTPAVLTLTAVPVTPVPQPVTVTLTPAAIALTAAPVTPTGGAAPSTVTLTPAALTLTAVPVTPVPRAVNRTLTPAQFTLTALPVVTTPLPVTVPLTPAALALTAVPVTPMPQPVTVHLTAAGFTLAAVAVDAQPSPVRAAPHGVAVRRPARTVTAHTSAGRVTWSGSPATARRTR